MPEQRILDALNMTPSQWGALPVDVGPNPSNERKELRKKAMQIINSQTSPTHGVPSSASIALNSLNERVSVLERQQGREAPGNTAVHVVESRVSELERRTTAIENDVKLVKRATDTAATEHDTKSGKR